MYETEEKEERISVFLKKKPKKTKIQEQWGKGEL